ncbi:hypothetical protein [Clostridium thermobutyricum]|uniref:helix-turn-helix transcriptional regulator n=1 Tax=Clostridium thermobutyricum TaxID=29372 RepID=UPI0018AB0777|nr:hypothetical protein [Clostridium thermobutyricum]
MGKDKIWTEEDTISLKRLIQEGCTTKMIATILGKSESCITQHKRKYGLHCRRYSSWSSKEEEKLRKLYYEGYSDKQIAQILNKSVSVIKEHRKNMALTDMNAWGLDWEEKYIQKYFINQLLSCESMNQAVFKTGIASQTITTKIEQFVKSNIITKDIYKELQNKLYKRRIRFD